MSSTAIVLKLLPVETGQSALAMIVGTMLLARVAIQFSGALAEALSKGYRARDQETMQRIAEITRSARDHVVVCGFGRTGQNVAEILHRRGHDYVALDLDPERVSETQAANITVVYGDATRRAVLEAAGTNRARALVVTVGQPHVAERIVTQARSLNPELAILVRTRDDAHFDALKAAGASDILPEGLESSLMLGAQLLALRGDSEEAIGQTLGAIRTDQYLSLRRFYHGSETATEDDANSEERRAVALSPVGGNFTLSDLLQAYPGVMVTGIVRSGVRSELPQSDTSVRPGDVLELCGTRDELDRVTEYLAGRIDASVQSARTS